MHEGHAHAGRSSKAWAVGMAAVTEAAATSPLQASEGWDRVAGMAGSAQRNHTKSTQAGHHSSTARMLHHLVACHTPAS